MTDWRIYRKKLLLGDGLGILIEFNNANEIRDKVISYKYVSKYCLSYLSNPVINLNNFSLNLK